MNMEDDNEDSSHEGELLSAHDCLSSETLLALVHFQEHGFFQEQDDDEQKEETGAAISSELGFVAYTEKDSKVIEETYKRLQQKETEKAALLDEKNHLSEAVRRTEELKAPTDSTFVETLQRDGVVRIDSVIDKGLCQALLESINIKLESADAATEPGFGNVFSRHQRFDMYLRPQGHVKEALDQLLHESAPLAKLFKELLLGKPGAFHELSSLVADPGADSQPLHPDAKYSEDCPIWTVFCALQDVEEEMGPTVMLPGSHTQQAHENFNSAESRHEQLATATYARSVLRQGDVAVMDARCFHFGSANTSDKRRVLFYFTIRNPAYDGDYPDCGSLFDDLKLSTSDQWGTGT
jgi:hypothetical protein